MRYEILRAQGHLISYLLSLISYLLSLPTKQRSFCGGPFRDFTCAGEMNSPLRQGFAAQNACTGKARPRCAGAKDAWYHVGAACDYIRRRGNTHRLCLRTRSAAHPGTCRTALRLLCCAYLGNALQTAARRGRRALRIDATGHSIQPSQTCFLVCMALKHIFLIFLGSNSYPKWRFDSPAAFHLSWLIVILRSALPVV